MRVIPCGVQFDDADHTWVKKEATLLTELAVDPERIIFVQTGSFLQGLPRTFRLSEVPDDVVLDVRGPNPWLNVGWWLKIDPDLRETLFRKAAA